MKAVVFAAGKGERLWPLTETTPKPLLPVAGRPIIEHTLRALVKAGIRDIAIVTSYQEEQVREFIGTGSKLGFRASFIHQDTPKGTGDALKSSEKWLSGESKFIVIYGDDFYSTTSVAKFVEKAALSKTEMVGAAWAEDPSRFGRLVIEKGTVKEIREKTGSKGPDDVNAGLYLFSDAFLSHLENVEMSSRGEYELTDAINHAVRSGVTVRAFSFGQGNWQSITFPWDLLEANRQSLQSIPHSVRRGTIELGVRLVKPVIAMAGVVIKAGCRLEGPIVIGENSTIGPNSYIRPFTSIGKDCKVGASCEVKASVLMDGAKVPHLSYIGDSILGRESSLGAGTITANLRFDNSTISSTVKGQPLTSGRRKLGAVLGDHVRTGINVSIFPGVKIGPGAWIWPGVTVMRDVSSGERVRSTVPSPRPSLASAAGEKESA